MLTIAAIFFVMIHSGSICQCFPSPSTTINTASARSSSRHTTMMTPTDDVNDDSKTHKPSNKSTTAPTRREILSQTILALTTAATTSTILSTHPKPADADIEGIATPSPADPNPTPLPQKDADGLTQYKTQSGLRYIDIRAGASDRTPRYGELCQISYKAYIRLPPATPGGDSDLQQYDSDKAYLTKHGNGRLIPGLDEGLHTMAVGGRRRLVIPPKLGYVGPGVLGPLPDTPWGRYKLNRLLDGMVERKGGNVVVDVELRSVVPDEADQGYYDDSTIEPGDFELLRRNLSATAREAKERGEAAVDFLDGIQQ